MWFFAANIFESFTERKNTYIAINPGTLSPHPPPLSLSSRKCLEIIYHEYVTQQLYIAKHKSFHSSTNLNFAFGKLFHNVCTTFGAYLDLHFFSHYMNHNEHNHDAFRPQRCCYPFLPIATSLHSKLNARSLFHFIKLVQQAEQKK